MRFVIGLMLGLTLGASLGLLAAPQRGSETFRVIRERIQSRDEADPDETTRRASSARTRQGRIPAP